MAIAGASNQASFGPGISLVTFTFTWDAVLTTGNGIPIYPAASGTVLYCWAIETTAAIGGTGSKMSVGTTGEGNAAIFMAAKAWEAASKYNSFVDGVVSTINTQFSELTIITVFADTVAAEAVAAGTIKGWLLLGNYT